MGVLTDLIYTGVAAATSPLWGYRMLKTGKWRTDWPGRLGRCALQRAAAAGQPTVLLHAVSLGEVNAVRQLVAEFEGTHPDWRLVIATTTDAGHDRAHQLFADRHEVVRYPLDFTPAVRRFLAAVQPDVVALVELEVWPNFVAECGRRDVPVLVVNGRLSERSFGRYRLIAPLVRRSFARLDAAGVQDAAYAERFVGLGTPADRVHITGTMKWDNAPLADDAPGSAELAAGLGIDRDRPLVVCGSTGPDEEPALVEQLLTLQLPPHDAPPQVLLAPRKPERFDAVAAELGARFGDIIRRTQPTPPPADRAIFLLDTLGELRAAYALADVAIVGRSFCAMHGSDPTDPISLGKPTIIGPHDDDFRDMMDDLASGRGIVQLSRIEEIPGAVRALYGTDAGRTTARRGRDVIRSRQGATRRHLQLIEHALATRGTAARAAEPASATAHASTQQE